MAEWYTAEDPERVVAAWPDAPVEDDEVLDMILDVAKVQVIAYGVGIPDDVLPENVELVDEEGDPIDPPARYVYAQLQQAKNLWNAGRVNSDGNVGLDAYTFTPRPLDKTIRSIIRPLDITNVF